MEREKRAAELHDEKLFKQPPPMDDCPICMLPLYHHLLRGQSTKDAVGIGFAVDASMQLKNEMVV